MLFCFSLSILSSIFLIFSSIISYDASILSCSSLTSFGNLKDFSLLTVISDENMSILWLVTSDAEFTVSIRTFSCCWNISGKIDLMVFYDVVRIESHLNYVFGFCSIFASCHNNKLKQTDTNNKLKFGLDFFTDIHL